MTIGEPSGSALGAELDFTAPVTRDGYVWWYVDGVSDDGAHGLTVIAFIGSVFSPYYAWARRRGRGDPENFVALNVALYGRSRRWAMTERGRDALTRTCRSLRIGPSSLAVDGDALVISIDETTVPWPRALRGEVRVWPKAFTGRTFDLDPNGRHRWRPIAPRCRLTVSMDQPSLRWSGDGYLDRNQGAAPLEKDFSYWDWSRAWTGDRTVILYDVLLRDRRRRSIGLDIDDRGRTARIEPPPRRALPANVWRVPRSTQSESDARVLDTLEDTPFYSRSTIRTHLGGSPVEAMHESLSLDRFSRRWVQMLLPFRMPRWR